MEAINWRLVAAAPSPHLPLDHLATGAATIVSDALKGSRQAFVPDAGAYQEVPVYDRYALGPDFTSTGPAIIEENESTIVVGTTAQIRIDAFSNVVISMLTSLS